MSIQCRNWVSYALWDNDSSKNNNLPGIGNIGSIRSQCAKMGLGAVRIQSASQVHNVLRPMVQKAGYNLRRGAGVPLAIDYSMINQYQALDDAGIDVMPILSELRSKYGYRGDHQTDQTGGKQHLAGFGWGRSNAAPGIEDWGFQHGQQVLVCSDNA